MAYVYILKLINNHYYVGSCRDINKRLKQHNQGYVVSTKNKRPFTVMYIKLFSNYRTAYKEEQRIKNWKKRKSIENLYNNDLENIAIKNGPIV